MTSSTPETPDEHYPNPFEALGLPERPDLTDEQVRAAWRKIAAATHPDRPDGGDLARYTAASAAYAELRTPWGRSEAYADLADRPDGPVTAPIPVIPRRRGTAAAPAVAAAAGPGVPPGAGPPRPPAAPGHPRHHRRRAVPGRAAGDPGYPGRPGRRARPGAVVRADRPRGTSRRRRNGEPRT